MKTRTSSFSSMVLAGLFLLGILTPLYAEDVIVEVTPADPAATEAPAAEAAAAPAAVTVVVEPVEAPAPAPVVVDAAPAPAAEAEVAPAPAPAPVEACASCTEAEPAPEKVVTPLTKSWAKEKPGCNGKAVTRNGEAINVDNMDRGSMDADGSYSFYVPMVTGDKEKVEKLQIWKDWAEYITFNEVSGEEISAFREKLLKTLQEAGYIFAQVDFPTKPWSQGFFVARVDCGPLGNITVKNEGRYYTQEQIINKLSNRDRRFNYAAVRNKLADLNSGDIKVDTTLKPSKRNGRIYVDAEVEYDDSLPIHGSIEFNNTTSREAESDTRIRTTLQHANLTKHDDVLTIGYMTDGDVFDSANAVYGSYMLPLGDQWTLGLFGSWTDSDYDNVVPESDVSGRGYAAGLQIERELYADAFKRWTAAFGWKLARTKNTLTFYGYSYDTSTAVISMPYLTIGYSDLVYDKYNGRNFATVTFTGNKADKYGSSHKETFLEEGWGCDGDFFQAKFSAARVQRLFDGEDQPGRWTLFARAQGTYSDDTVPNSCREYIGGFDTVRGYNESEVGGDNMLTATLELRTPLLENFIPAMKQSEEELADPNNWKLHRLQGLVFMDYGYVSTRNYSNSNSDGRVDSQSMLSAGLGLRLGITKYAQAAADYGLALIKHASEDTPDKGRFHLSLQLQF